MFILLRKNGPLTSSFMICCVRQGMGVTEKWVNSPIDPAKIYAYNLVINITQR